MVDRIINLRRARKRKARDEKRAEADRNAAAHGRSAQEINLTKARADREQRHIDGHRRTLTAEQDD